MQALEWDRVSYSLDSMTHHSINYNIEGEARVVLFYVILGISRHQGKVIDHQSRVSTFSLLQTYVKSGLNILPRYDYFQAKSATRWHCCWWKYKCNKLVVLVRIWTVSCIPHCDDSKTFGPQQTQSVKDFRRRMNAPGQKDHQQSDGDGQIAVGFIYELWIT